MYRSKFVRALNDYDKFSFVTRTLTKPFVSEEKNGIAIWMIVVIFICIVLLLLMLVYFIS